MVNKYALAIFLFCLGFYANAQEPQRIDVNPVEEISGHYLAIVPNGEIKAVLVLLAGYSQGPENTLPETKLDSLAYDNNILTISFAAGYEVYARERVVNNLTAVLKDVVKRYKVDPSKFVLGGFSAGGTIALRYVELCNQYPDRYPVHPKGIFTVDSPIDIFSCWELFEQIVKDNFSKLAVDEANSAMQMMREDRGVPRDNVAKYAEVAPFSMNPAYCNNEKYLKEIAVRTYHEINVEWRLVNRLQTVHNSNYEFSAELVKRLMVMGNKKAQFIQSKRPGIRANGMRHPHSWSIVDEEECIQWIKSII
ncbi:MAG: alpha/beta hydrolase [Bacteroidetes bacterium]|nr:alpha/beta hydrolase [Bacteroidota bacterium]